jgi:hypothetical protein
LSFALNIFLRCATKSFSRPSLTLTCSKMIHVLEQALKCRF